MPPTTTDNHPPLTAGPLTAAPLTARRRAALTHGPNADAHTAGTAGTAGTTGPAAAAA
jgi:hypothetical protein